MSEEQLKAFLEKLKDDSSLQEKLKAAADSDAVLAIAKEAGFSISADEFTKAQSTELSDEELEGVAGGLIFFSWLAGNCRITKQRNFINCSQAPSQCRAE